MKNGFNVKTLWVRFYVLVTISSLWSDWGLQVSLLLVLVLLHHLRRQLSRGHSDEGLSPETKATPTVTVSSCHTHSLFAAQGFPPDVRLLSGGARLGDGRRPEAPPLPHGACHLGIQPPHEDATLKTAKTVSSLTVGSGTFQQVSCSVLRAYLSPDTVMRCLQSWLNLMQVTISEKYTTN